jgi:hypothetical protein
MNSPVSMSRRKLFSVLPAGCLGCAAAARSDAQTGGPAQAHSWTEKADVTWEEIFRFAFQKDLIPILKALAGQIGREKFVQMLQDTTGGLAAKGMAGRSLPNRDFATFAANLRSLPPIIQHALQYEVLEDSPRALEYRVTQCLWAKSFREGDAGDIGYAMVCHPDYAIAAGFNPKLKLTRTKTLMQGGDSCHFRYSMEA